MTPSPTPPEGTYTVDAGGLTAGIGLGIRF
jgi:hypothetical protein